MDFEKHEELKRLRALLGIIQPEEDPVASWGACAKVGNDLLLSWLLEEPVVPLCSEVHEQVLQSLAKSDPGPDAAMLRIYRVLDTSHAGQGELIHATRLIAKAVELRRAQTQRRWIMALQRLCILSEPVDEVTRGMAMRALLQTDTWSNVEWILKGVAFVTEFGVRAQYLEELKLKPEILEKLLARYPDFAADVDRLASEASQ